MDENVPQPKANDLKSLYNPMKEKTPAARELDALCINTIRFLCIDAVQKAESGHPGLPMGAAPMAYVLWTRFLKHNPSDPQWFDRDRFILSAGHGSMLIYSLLYLTGYDLPLEEIKRFRQWGSKTPGHPERGLTPGVEVTTGPLGQGFGNGVGMAIAEAYLAARYNRPGFPAIDHYTYAIVSDGDLMEGVASEAASLAGHLRLGKLIYLYDDNHVSLSAGTSLSFSEDSAKRFQAYRWQTLRVEDGNDISAIEKAIGDARADRERPSLICVRTHLGFGSPHKQDTFAAHGSPLGEDEVAATRKSLGWPSEPPFYVPQAALDHCRRALSIGSELQEKWKQQLTAYRAMYPESAAELERLMAGTLPQGWESALPRFSPDAKGMATRVASGKIMAALASRLPELLGGSADLNPSTHTVMPAAGDFESPYLAPEDTQGSIGGGFTYAGRNIHFGVREHAMGAVANGLAAHGGTLPFVSTFLIFSDYMRPPIRLASFMDLHVIYVFTHDSIALGEDGPTHQPVEQLLGLRSVPGLILLRPADANETALAWRIAIERRGSPVALSLSRQSLPILDPERYPAMQSGVSRGGYILADAANGVPPEIALIATGSEVHLALAARDQLARGGVRARMVSLPSWNLFEEQPARYRDSVLPSGIPMLAIEAGTPLGWKPYAGAGIEVVGVNGFGASAPGDTILKEYGFTVENVCLRAETLLRELKEQRK
jgi:transketolase